MSATTAPSVKAELLTLIQADATLSAIQSTYAYPGQSIAQEALFYGRTIGTENPDSMGQRKQRERYEVQVYIYVALDSDDPQTCETRCWDLVSALENLVRANNSNTGALSAALKDNLGGNAAGWVVYGGTEMTPFAYSGQRVCEALCKINVTAIK